MILTEVYDIESVLEGRITTCRLRRLLQANARYARVHTPRVGFSRRSEPEKPYSGYGAACRSFKSISW